MGSSRPRFSYILGVILGIYGSIIIGRMEKKIETLGPFKGIYIYMYRNYGGVILGMMENTMETTIVYWGAIM